MVQTRNRGPLGTPAADHNHQPTTATIPDPGDTWADRLAAMLAERQRRRDERAAVRNEMAVRRRYGKAAYHRAKAGGSGE